MSDSTIETEELSSDQLLAAFTKGSFIKWIVVAVVVHIVFIAVCSIGSIVKRFAPQKPAAAEEEVQAEATAPAAEEAQQPAATAETPATKPAVSDGDATDAELLQQRSDSPVVKRITEAAKPEEIPDEPGDLGISLEDTQVR